MGRGNGGLMIFTDDEDRLKFLSLLEEGVERFGHSIYAYCLMGNHFHLVLRTGEIRLSAIMQNLMFRYTRHFNQRLRRNGHLFQGRFKSVLVDEEKYLLELVRYVHLNPVRSGLVKLPEEWRWSGHLAYLGMCKDKFLDADWFLGNFGGSHVASRRRYEKFVMQGVGEKKREDFYKGEERPGVLGGEEFLKRMHVLKAEPVKPAMNLEKVVAGVCSVCEMSPSILIEAGRGRQGSEGRAIVGLISQNLKTATLSEVAEYTGRDLATLSHSVSRLRKRLKDDPEKACKIGKIVRKLIQGEKE